MLCIFCRAGNSFKTVEHIIPESLGNVNHVLPKGIVCDSCNNYFAVKVEKVLLEKPYFVNLRHRNFIKTKKDRLVPDMALFPHPNGGWAKVWIDERGLIFDGEDQQLISMIKNGSINSMVIPTIPPLLPNDNTLSRFLSKAGLESVAHFSFNGNNYDDSFIKENNLDSIRIYARFGSGIYWPYHQRKVYEETDRFINEDIQEEPYEILHEMDFLMLNANDIYYVLVIMGIEYVINLHRPNVDSYTKWLLENDGRCPIRRGKEHMLKA